MYIFLHMFLHIFVQKLVRIFKHFFIHIGKLYGKSEGSLVACHRMTKRCTMQLSRGIPHNDHVVVTGSYNDNLRALKVSKLIPAPH